MQIVWPRPAVSVLVYRAWVLFEKDEYLAFSKTRLLLSSQARSI